MFCDLVIEEQAMPDVEAFLDSTSLATADLGGELKPLLFAFRDIGVVGAEVLAEMARGAASAAYRFADFIAQTHEIGQLAEWIPRTFRRSGISARCWPTWAASSPQYWARLATLWATGTSSWPRTRHCDLWASSTSPSSPTSKPTLNTSRPG